MVEDLGCGSVMSGLCFPWVHHQPVTVGGDGDLTHIDPVIGRLQAGLLVCIRYWGEIAAKNFESSVSFDVITRDLEHAEVEQGRRREGPASDEDEREAGRVPEGAAEPGPREVVAGRDGGK